MVRSYQASDLISLGATVRERRRALDLTQEQLAARLHWSQERVSTLENGKYGMPSLPLLAHLAEALDLPLRALLEAVGFPVGDLWTSPQRPGGNREAPTGAQLALDVTLPQLLAIDAPTLNGSMDEASDLLVEAMGAEKVDVFVYRPELDALVALGTSRTRMGDKQVRLGLDRLPIADGGREVEVFQTGRNYHTDHANRDPEMLRGAIELLGVRSMYVVPMRVQGQIRGVVAAASSHPDRFSSVERELFDAASRWIGIVAHRAELLEELTRRTVQETRQAVAEEMLSLVSHDLGNQITPVKGRVDLLLRRIRRGGPPDPERLESDLGDISESLHQLTLMITRLLDSARLSGGVFSVATQPTDLVRLIAEVAEAARVGRPELVTRLPGHLVVHADPDRLRQVVQNLVGNAVQHTPPGCPIQVSATEVSMEGGEWAVIEVSDRGPGISPELLPRLFTRHAAGKDSSGLGLGLYLSRGIAEAHGGRLEVRSEIGEGSTFVVSLPVRTSP